MGYSRTQKLAYSSLSEDVTISYNDDEHTYTWVERNLLMSGVTGVIDLISKGGALTQWAANSAADAFRDSMLELFARPGDVHKIDIEEAHAKAKLAHRTISKTATNIGTMAHDYADLRFARKPAQSGSYPDEAKAACTTFDKWYEQDRLQITSADRIVASLKYLYAGRPDAIGNWTPINKLVIADLKTCKPFQKKEGPWIAYRIQLAAYALAYYEETGTLIKDGLVLRLPKEDPEKPVEEYHIELTDELTLIWVRLKGLYQALNKYTDEHGMKRIAK